MALVVGGAVALALLGVAIFFLMKQMGQYGAVSEELDGATENFRQILDRKNHPGGGKINNIELAKKDHERLVALVGQVRNEFGPAESKTNLTNREFRALLDTTITRLQRESDRKGIQLPDGNKDYWFTFNSQKTTVEFKSLQNLSLALMEVGDLVEIMYEAKVHDITGIKRVSAGTDDTGVGDYITDKKMATNQFTIHAPYEISFQGFTTELENTLEGLIKSKRAFVVKNIIAEKAPENRASPGMFPPAFGNPYGERRYGMGGPGRFPPGFAPPPQQPAPGAGSFPRPVGPGGLQTMLDEHKLKFTLTLEAVRLKPASANPAPTMEAPVY